MLVKALVIALVAVTGVACGGPPKHKIMADTPTLPFQAADADEIAGTDEDEDEDTDTGAETDGGSAQNPQQ